MNSEPLVNSSMLAQHTEKYVTVIGKITYISPTGNEIKLKLADDVEVKVALQDQLDDVLDGYVEVTAKVERNGSLLAERLISFGSCEIDLSLLNEAINMTQFYPDLFTRS